MTEGVFDVGVGFVRWKARGFRMGESVAISNFFGASEESVRNVVRFSNVGG